MTDAELAEFMGRENVSGEEIFAAAMSECGPWSLYCIEFGIEFDVQEKMK